MQRQSKMSRSGDALWEQYTEGTVEFGKFVFMKLSISFWLAKVNVGLVLKVTKTLFILVFGLPTNDNPRLAFEVLLVVFVLFVADRVQTDG